MRKTFGTAKQNKTLEEKIDTIWRIADSIIFNAVDLNSRARYNSWLADTDTSINKKQKIKEVLAWADTVWLKYAELKQKIIDGDDVSFPVNEISECPWTFWDIAEA